MEEVSHDQLNFSSAVVAEWLRRLTRNQLRSPCTGSNPVNCDFFFSHLLRARTYVHIRCVISISRKGYNYVLLNWLLADGWQSMDEQTVGPMDGWIDGWIDGSMDRCLVARMLGLDGAFNRYAMSHLKTKKQCHPRWDSNPQSLA